MTEYPEEHIHNGAPTTLSDQELAETWRAVARYYDLRDSRCDDSVRELRVMGRLNTLESELAIRDLRPTEDDDGILFGVETDEGERLV